MAYDYDMEQDILRRRAAVAARYRAMGDEERARTAERVVMTGWRFEDVLAYVGRAEKAVRWWELRRLAEWVDDGAEEYERWQS